MKFFTPFAALALSALTMSAPAWSQARAYATNEGAGTVSVIDMETDTVLSTIETGGKPRGLAVCARVSRRALSALVVSAPIS